MIHRRLAETITQQTPCKLGLIKVFRGVIKSHLSLSLAMLQFCLGVYLFFPREFNAKMSADFH